MDITIKYAISNYTVIHIKYFCHWLKYGNYIILIMPLKFMKEKKIKRFIAINIFKQWI